MSWRVHAKRMLGAMVRFPFGGRKFESDPLAGRAAFQAVLVAAAGVGMCIALVIMFAVHLPQMDELERYHPSTTTDLYDVHGRIFGSFSLERRVVEPYSEFPQTLREAIYSIEDKNFETNGGINLVRMVGAAYRDVHSHGKAQGGSTLTMQLARNLFLSAEKTYGRKVQEIFLTLQIERHFTKQQIFTMYANQIYLGHGTYGFEAGSEYYFSKHAHDLTLPEAALLAALPKGPELYSPVRNPERALRRRNLVLDEMLEDRKITRAQAAQAKAAPLGLHIEPPPNTEAPYFVEEVRRQLERDYGSDEVHQAGLKVYTTLDLDLQHAAEKALLDGCASYERRHGWKNRQPNVLATTPELASYRHPDWTQPLKDGAYFHALVMDVSAAKIAARIGGMKLTMEPADWAWTQHFKATDLVKPGDVIYVRVVSGAETNAPKVVLEQDSGTQSSLMAVNNDNGEVLSMIGGRDFALSQFNRATQAQRQVGSSFKPYVYATALENGAKITDTVLDAPTTFSTPGGPYTPHDFEAGYRGAMSMTEAFAESRNIPALRLADHVGIKKVVEMAHRFGVTSNIPTFLPVAIGAADITLAEQVGAYSVFPNDGIRIQPHVIRKVTTADGQALETKTPEVRSVITAETARAMMVLLQSVTRMGTAAAAASLHHEFGGKTGTTNNYTDAWFIGFSPSVTCGVWIGYDDRQSLGEKETGAKAALPIWMDYMRVAIADRPNESFSRSGPPKQAPPTLLTASTEAPKADTDEDDDAGDDAPKPAPKPAQTPAIPTDAMPADEGGANKERKAGVPAAKPVNLGHPELPR